MRVSATKTAPRVERNVYLQGKKIKAYGKDNDYPQKVLEIVNSSGTGLTCVNIIEKFIEGAGFADQALADYVINERGERANGLLRKTAKDFTYYNGFSVLVKYNGLGLPEEYYVIPFEHCRLGINQDGTFDNTVHVYSDWTGLTGKAFVPKNVKILNRFNPLQAINEMAAAGGPENYLGQIMYFTAEGDWDYPMCPFDPVITDMLTEESVSTVKHRNAKYNFLPSGILVRKGIKPILTDDGRIDETNPRNRENIESAEGLKKAQGDENAAKIWIVDIDSDEEKPEFLDFTPKNYDTQFQTTEQTVQDNIGRMFMIPPILRGEDIGAGFGADLMTNAYNFMNSVTDNERSTIERAWKDLLQYYQPQFADTNIQPLKYEQEI